MSAPVHRGRFAPSPTGHLHLGNARTALLGWLWARSHGGEFLLRVEDLDGGRCRPEYVADLHQDLDYLGLTFDPPRLLQSERKAVYDCALEQLQEAGRLYPCFCTRAEIARAATAPHGASDEGPRYPGTCAAGGQKSAPFGKTPALRFRPRPGVVTAFTDLVAGPYAQDVEASVGDFVVRRNDGVASYQLAVVVDDQASGITHVLRGEDLLASTPRQIQLSEALGYDVPAFAHVGLVVGPDGKRMAKREGLASLTELRQRGVAPGRVLGLLGKWSGLSDGSPVALSTLLERFTLERVPKGPVCVHADEVTFVLGAPRP